MSGASGPEKTVNLPKSPALGGLYVKAFSGILPKIGKPRAAKVDAQLPKYTAALTDIRIDKENLAEYSRLTGLRVNGELPVTYSFTLAYPVILSIMTDDSFPFAAAGAVHVKNTIERFRKITIDEKLTLKVYAHSLLEHRAGLIVNFVSEFFVGEELVIRQVSSFINRQKTSLSDAPREPKPEEEPLKLPPPTTTLVATKGLIKEFAANTGDRNPIHVSSLAAKAFGFPSTIAHGMWSAAALLAVLEGKIPDKVKYSVTFGKPVILPTKVNEYVSREAKDGKEYWEVVLRSAKKPDIQHLFARGYDL